MARRPQIEWPAPSYYVGSPNFIHALGVISANYNLLEYEFRRFFRMYTRLPHSTSTQIFMTTTNETRANLLKMCLEESAHPARIRNRVLRFVEGYLACAQNRNILMHSQTIPIIASSGWQPVHFRKMSKKAPFKLNTYAPGLKSLRSIADAMHEFQAFGHELLMHVLQNFEPVSLSATEALLPPFALPDRPAVPPILSPRRR